jgi:4-hydroxy-tetrahydrodipicolinate synthase
MAICDVCPNVVAIKEASGNISQVAKLASLAKGRIDIYSGNDDQIVPIMSLGGKGVISVLSNVMPEETHRMTQLCLDGDYKSAAELQLKYLKLINALFCEVNPVPVKTAMAEMGWCDVEMRLPLCEMDDANKARLLAVMKAHNLI